MKYSKRLQLCFAQMPPRVRVCVCAAECRSTEWKLVVFKCFLKKAQIFKKLWCICRNHTSFKSWQYYKKKENMTFNFRHTISRWNIHREMRVATTQRREIHRSIVSGTENKIVSLWILNACDIRAIDDVPRCISDASEISCVPQVHTSDKSWAIGIEESIINLKRTAFTRYFERPLYVCQLFAQVSKDEYKYILLPIYYI